MRIRTGSLTNNFLSPEDLTRIRAVHLRALNGEDEASESEGSHGPPTPEVDVEDENSGIFLGTYSMKLPEIQKHSNMNL